MDRVTRRHMLASAAIGGAAAAVGPAVVPGVASAEPPRPAAPPCEWTEEELADRRRVLAAGLTEDEADCWLLVARAGGKFFSLPEMHPSIDPEVAQAIHVIQDKLLMRPTYRKYLDGFGDGSSGSAYR